MPVIKPRKAIKPIKATKSKRFYSPPEKKDKPKEIERKEKIKRRILRKTKTNKVKKVSVDRYEMSSLPMVPRPIEGVELHTGNVYWFKYVPVTIQRYPDQEERARHLPFWDRNPLFLMFDYRIINGKACLFGANLHYLPEEEREDFVRYVKDGIQDMDKLKWSVVQDDYGGRFKYLSVALRIYHITHVSSVEKTMDIHMISDEVFNEKYEEMMSSCRARFKMESTQAKLTTADLDRMVRIAKSGKSWYKYVYDTFIKKK